MSTSILNTNKAVRRHRIAAFVVATAMILFFAPAGLLNPRSANAYAVCGDGGCVHEYMARTALELYPAQYWNYIESGITHEDHYDHIYSLNVELPVVSDKFLVTVTHFWNADLGPDAPATNANEPPTPLGVFPNAWQKMKALWSVALGYAAIGDYPNAYHYLGHVVHLLEDATVPAHDHDDPHVKQVDDDAYHVWMDDPGSDANNPPHAVVTAGELNNLKQLGILSIPNEEPDKLKWLLYSTDQVGDFFASDDFDGDARADGYDGNAVALSRVQEELDSLALNVRSPRRAEDLDDNDEDNNDNDGDLSRVRQYSYLRGIRAVAAMYRLFEQTIRNQLTLAVKVERIEEDEKHDGTCPEPGCEPDFYARTTINGLESRNRGERRDNQEDIDVTWPFGATVPISGSVPVHLEVWDDDGAYEDQFTLSGSDDQSDIDKDGGSGDLTLDMTVDIGKCLRREAGAISGDHTGACGERLSEAGDAEDEASLVFFRILPSRSPPAADAGGPYSTDEGQNVELSATGSTDPDNDIVTYAWDLDGDGACDDVANDSTPDFTSVGQDGITTVKVCVTDAVGLTSEDTSTVTVRNVAPSISLSSDGPKGENTSITVSGTIRDPGWLDPLSGTISWGDGTSTQALAGTLENVRPDGTLTFTASHTFGDNGTFTAQVCAADDDTAPCSSIGLQVTNTAPTAVIDLTGAVSVNGVPTIIGHAGQAVAFSGRSVDPGSDDLTLTWTWGDGTAASTLVSLVNPPNVDPAVSPSIQPRDVTYPLSHGFGDACVYETRFGAIDDDGGSAQQAANVVIVGNGHPNQPHGWWKQQVRFHATGKGSSDFTAAVMTCYLQIAGYMSRVFNERTLASTFAQAYDVLDVSSTSDIYELLDLQLLANWLNFANGAIAWDRRVDTNGDKRADTRFLDAITAAESLRLNPNATRTQLDRMKVIVESWTNLP